LSGRLTILIRHDHAATNKACARILIKDVGLKIKRSREPNIVIVEKSYVWRRALKESDVARARNALVPFDPNMTNAGQLLTHTGRLI
jgi:hypothetical protein